MTHKSPKKPRLTRPRRARTAQARALSQRTEDTLSESKEALDIADLVPEDRGSAKAPSGRDASGAAHQSSPDKTQDASASPFGQRPPTSEVKLAVHKTETASKLYFPETSIDLRVDMEESSDLLFPDTMVTPKKRTVDWLKDIEGAKDKDIEALFAPLRPAKLPEEQEKRERPPLPRAPLSPPRASQTSPPQPAGGPRSSQDLPRAPRSSPDLPRAPRSSQDLPRAPQNPPRAPQNPPRAPRSSPDLPRAPRSSPDLPRAPRSSPDLPRAPQNPLRGPRAAQPHNEATLDEGASPPPPRLAPPPLEATPALPKRHPGARTQPTSPPDFAPQKAVLPDKEESLSTRLPFAVLMDPSDPRVGTEATLNTIPRPQDGIIDQARPLEGSVSERVEAIQQALQNKQVLQQYLSRSKKASLRFSDAGVLTRASKKNANNDDKVVFPTFEGEQLTTLSIPVDFMPDAQGNLCELHLALLRVPNAPPSWSKALVELKAGANKTPQYKQWSPIEPHDLGALTPRQQDHISFLLMPDSSPIYHDPLYPFCELKYHAHKHRKLLMLGAKGLGNRWLLQTEEMNLTPLKKDAKESFQSHEGELQFQLVDDAFLFISLSPIPGLSSEDALEDSGLFVDDRGNIIVRSSSITKRQLHVDEVGEQWVRNNPIHAYLVALLFPDFVERFLGAPARRVAGQSTHKDFPPIEGPDSPQKTLKNQAPPARDTQPSPLGPARAEPPLMGPPAAAGPILTGPPLAGPPLAGPPQTGPPQTGQAGLPQTGLPQARPLRTGAPSAGPPQAGPPQVSPHFAPPGVEAPTVIRPRPTAPSHELELESPPQSPYQTARFHPGSSMDLRSSPPTRVVSHTLERPPLPGAAPPRRTPSYENIVQIDDSPAPSTPQPDSSVSRWPKPSVLDQNPDNTVPGEAMPLLFELPSSPEEPPAVRYGADSQGDWSALDPFTEEKTSPSLLTLPSHPEQLSQVDDILIADIESEDYEYFEEFDELDFEEEEELEALPMLDAPPKPAPPLASTPTPRTPPTPAAPRPLAPPTAPGASQTSSPDLPSPFGGLGHSLLQKGDEFAPEDDFEDDELDGPPTIALPVKSPRDLLGPAPTVPDLAKERTLKDDEGFEDFEDFDADDEDFEDDELDGPPTIALTVGSPGDLLGPSSSLRDRLPGISSTDLPPTGTAMRKIKLETLPLSPRDLRLHLDIPGVFVGQSQEQEVTLSIFGDARSHKFPALGVVVQFSFSQAKGGKVYPQVIVSRTVNIRKIRFAEHDMEIFANRNENAHKGFNHIQELPRGHQAKVDLSATDQARGIMLLTVKQLGSEALVGSIRISWSLDSELA